MAITFRELQPSRESITNLLTGQTTAVILTYHVLGTDEDLAVKAFLIDETAETYDGLLREEIGIRPIWVDTDADDGEWECFVRYVQPYYAVDESTYQFEVGGATGKIFVGKNKGNYGRSGEPFPPNHRGLINVRSDGTGVDGTEIVVPKYDFSETHFFIPAAIDGAYKAGLFALTAAPVNNDDFRGFKAGEVLFLGAQGTYRRSQGYWEINFKFSASPNLTAFDVDGITVASKKGWEYMWADTREEKVGVALVRRVSAVHIDQVYDLGDYSVMGIGTD